MEGLVQFKDKPDVSYYELRATIGYILKSDAKDTLKCIYKFKCILADLLSETIKPIAIVDFLENKMAYLLVTPI